MICNHRPHPRGSIEDRRGKCMGQWLFDCPKSSRNTKAMISFNSRVMQLNWKKWYKEQSYDQSLQCGGFSDGCCCFIPQKWGSWLQTSSPSLSVGYMLLFCLCHSMCMLGSFQCWGILLRWHIVGQDPVVLAAGVGMGEGGWFFISHPIFSFLCPISWETARHDCSIVVSAVNPNGSYQLLQGGGLLA